MTILIVTAVDANLNAESRVFEGSGGETIPQHAER